MVSLSAVQASNAVISASPLSSQTAFFVGATSGLGLATLTSYARHSKNPKIYIVGRNESKLSAIISKLKIVNPNAILIPIVSEISLLKNVDTTCSAISSSEARLDLLVLSPGFFKIQKQSNNADGINPVLSLVYYVRARFIYNLLPLLDAAPAARIMSIFGAGHEGNLIENDLLLENNYSMNNMTAHAATMNTLLLQEIARNHRTIGCVHVFPGTVVTPLFEGMAEDWYQPFRSAFRGLMLPAIRLLTTGLDESGERLLFLITSARYPPASGEGNKAGVVLSKGPKTAHGSDEKVGSGCYLVGLNGEIVGDKKVLDSLLELGWDKKIWSHTLSVFEQAGVKVPERHRYLGE